MAHLFAREADGLGVRNLWQDVLLLEEVALAVGLWMRGKGQECMRGFGGPSTTYGTPGLGSGCVTGTKAMPLSMPPSTTSRKQQAAHQAEAAT